MDRADIPDYGGSHLCCDAKAGASVEPPPDVVIETTSPVGWVETITVPLGQFDVIQDGRGGDIQIKVLEVRRKKIRPANKPPYKWLLTATDGSFRVVRSMDETNAVRLWHASNDEPMELESCEVVIPA